MELPHLTKLALYVALTRAFGGTFFDFSGITTACALLGRPHPTQHPEYLVVHAVHCVSWLRFDKASREELIAACARILGVDLSANGSQCEVWVDAPEGVLGVSLLPTVSLTAL